MKDIIKSAADVTSKRLLFERSKSSRLLVTDINVKSVTQGKFPFHLFTKKEPAYALCMCNSYTAAV